MKLNLKIVFVFVLLLISIVITTETVQAQGFGVGAEICSYYWVCTEWSGDNCGTRTCLDLTGCNNTIGKPDETQECVAESSNTGGGSGGGGSSGSSGVISTSTEKGVFSISSKLVKINVDPNKYLTRRIELFSEEELSYKILVEPEDTLLITDKEFQTLDGKKKLITFKINSSGKIPGVYTYRVIIKNGYKEKEVFVVVKISETSQTIDFKINMPPKTRWITNQRTLTPEIVFDKELIEEVIVTYSLVSNTGERIILKSEKTTATKLNPLLQLPKYITKGYNVLEVKIESKDKTIIKYVMLLSDLEEEYMHVEEPKEIDLDKEKLEYTLIAMTVAIIIIMILSVIGNYRREMNIKEKRNQHKNNSEINKKQFHKNLKK